LIERRGVSNFIPSSLDLKLGVRMLFKHAGLTIVGGLGIAVAIAVVATFSTVLYTFLYPTLALDEADRLVALENWDIAINNEERRAIHDFVAWRDEMKTVVDISAFRNVGRNLVTPGAAAESVQVAEITVSGMRTSRVAALLGRTLGEADELPEAPGVLVIGYDVWRSRFFGDSAVVGRVVSLDEVPHTIVGVMPEGYGFPMNHQYWVPLRANPAAFVRGEGPYIFVFGRLAPGASREQAQAELSAIGARTAVAFPATHDRLRPQVLPYTYSLTDIQDMRLWEAALEALVIGLLVLVVAANVAVLVYARTAARHREIAVRTAIGASRSRVVSQLFAETLVFAVLSGMAGLALAQFGWSQALGILEEETGTLPFWIKRGMSIEMVVAVTLLTLLTAVIIGIVPALQATGRRVPLLRHLSSGAAMRLGGTWTMLIVAQVTIAMLGLPIALAFGWSTVGQGMRQPTFAADEFLAASVIARPESRPGALADLIQRLEQQPNIGAVTFAAGVAGSEPDVTIVIDGERPGGIRSDAAVRVSRVDVRFFDVLGVPLVAGRAFDRTDPASVANPILVNRTFASQLFGGGDVLGQRIRYDDVPRWAADVVPEPQRWYEIVGVVADLHANTLDAAMNAPVIYHPMALPSSGAVALTARVRSGSPAALGPRLQALAAEVEPALFIETARALSDYDRQQQIAVRLASLSIGLVMVSVLLLSGAGVYAMMSFTVAQRRKEIGIRAALGANPAQVIGSVFAHAGRQLGAGVAVGNGAVAVLDLLSRGALLGGRGLLFVPAITFLMLVAGLLAAIGPARRGLRVNATEALKAE
jgi:predicted permease